MNLGCWGVGKSFLIVFSSPDAKRSCLSGNAEWFEYWFERVFDYDKLFVDDERLSCIKCRGLPVTA